MSRIRRVVLALATIAIVGGLFTAPAGAHIDLTNPHGPEVTRLEMSGHGIYDRIYEDQHLVFTDWNVDWFLDIHFNGHAEWYSVTVNGQQVPCNQVFNNKGVAMRHDPLVFGHAVEPGTYVIEVQAHGDRFGCFNNPGPVQTFTLTVVDPPATLIGNHPGIPQEFTTTNPLTELNPSVPSISLPGGFTLGF